MSHRHFADNAGFTRHCWECVHSYDWDGNIGFCDMYSNNVEKYDSPNNGSTIAGGCGHYSDGKEPEPRPMTNDERYRRVCELLEEALQLMSEWGTNSD